MTDKREASGQSIRLNVAPSWAIARGMIFRLGTRGSPLALTQAGMTRDALVAAHPGLEVELVTVRTTGDRVQDRALAEIGGKALDRKSTRLNSSHT